MVMRVVGLLTTALLAVQASAFPNYNAYACKDSQCGNVVTPCMDNDNGKCLPRVDPTYNVTSGQCRAGTTDCCCTNGCCCPPTLPCQQQNDFKCMPMINSTSPSGQYCTFDAKTQAYPSGCQCSAGTLTCHEDPRKCTDPPPPPVPPSRCPPHPAVAG